MAKYDPALLALLEERARRRQAEAAGKCPACDHQQFTLASYVADTNPERYTMTYACDKCGRPQTLTVVIRDFGSAS